MDFTFLIGIGGLCVFMLLIIARQPVAYAMIVVGAGGIVLLSGYEILFAQLKTLAYGQFSIYDLSIVPMFVLMGSIASQSGLSKSIFRGANAWFGRFKGGVAMSAIAACAGFSSVCGSSVATASTMAKVAGPELKHYKYSDSLTTGTLAAGGVLGILIPPSVVLVIYAIMVEANIVSLFQAALLPGILAIIFFLLTIAIYVRIFPKVGPKGSIVSYKEFVEATIGIIPVLVIFGIVIIGIYLGFFNPTPAAAFGVFMITIYGILNRTVGLIEIRESLFETIKITGMIYLILFGAELFKIFMTRGGVPQALTNWIMISDIEPIFVIILFLISLIFLGCLMDSLSMILLMIPFFWPVLVEINGGLFVEVENSPFGMSTENLKIWFGILALIVVELGLITPPVGLNVFVISAHMKNISMKETFKGVIPFFCAEIIRIILIFSFPAIVLILPSIL